MGCGIGRGLAGCPACAVVGEGAIHLAARLVDGQPLGAVHLGGVERIAGLARLDEHFALVGKTLCSCQRAFAVHERQPAPGAIGIEARHVQLAVVESSRLARAPPG